MWAIARLPGLTYSPNDISLALKRKGLRKSFGYADDTAITESSSSLEVISRNIESAINQSISWDTAAGMTFNAERPKLMHFI